MKNHIHLLIQIGEIPLSKVMHHLASRYSQKVNRKYNIAGHLFQGRYKAIIIQDGIYFLRLIRYIHRNPIRARIVQNPGDYPWSSHNVYVNRNSISWVTKDFCLSKFGKTRGEAVKAYASYVSECELEEELNELRGDFKDGQILGDDEFLNYIRNQKLPEVKYSLSIESIIDVICEEFKIEKELLASKNRSKRISLARAVICKIAIDNGVISMTDLGNLFNRDRSTINGFLEGFKNKHKDLLSSHLNIETIVDVARKRQTQQTNA
jgi:hypothetical protein